MPADDGLGLDDDQGVTPAAPPSTKRDPEHPVDRGEPRPGPSVPEDGYLLAEGQDLEREICSGAEEGGEGVEKRSKHAAIMA